jgi:hypothetical protein
MKNKPSLGLLRTSYLSKEIKKMIPKSRETIPLLSSSLVGFSFHGKYTEWKVFIFVTTGVFSLLPGPKSLSGWTGSWQSSGCATFWPINGQLTQPLSMLARSLYWICDTSMIYLDKTPFSFVNVLHYTRPLLHLAQHQWIRSLMYFYFKFLQYTQGNASCWNTELSWKLRFLEYVFIWCARSADWLRPIRLACLLNGRAWLVCYIVVSWSTVPNYYVPVRLRNWSFRLCPRINISFFDR